MVKIGALFKQIRKKENIEIQQFKSFLYWVTEAKAIWAGKEKDQQARVFNNLVQIALRHIQSNHIRSAYINPEHSATKCLELGDWFGETWTFNEWPTYSSETSKYTVDLKNHIVFPTPWKPSGLTKNLDLIRDGSNDFKQSTNHLISLLLPFHIGFVKGGNHSITQGILNGNGTVIPTAIYDATPLLKDFSFDGEYWLKSGKRFSKPRYPEFGWVWEAYKLFYSLPPYTEQRET